MRGRRFGIAMIAARGMRAELGASRTTRVPGGLALYADKGTGCHRGGHLPEQGLLHSLLVLRKSFRLQIPNYALSLHRAPSAISTSGRRESARVQ